LEADARDPRVESVRWEVDDWARTTPRPFALEFDLGPLPRETTVTAAALDGQRQILYRQRAILNPGGRRLALEFLSPLDGQRVSGRTPVLVRASAPPGDSLVAVTLDAPGGEVALSGEDVLTAVVDLPAGTAPLTARVKTERGRVAERTILVNGRGFVAASDAHVVEQTVAVTKGGEPLEGLGIADFTIKDDRGACEIREVRLLRDAPLAIGLSIDTSMSLQYAEQLRTAAAGSFLERALRPGDIAFLQRFGVAVSEVVPWTGDRDLLRRNVLDLGYDGVPGTLLNAAILRALYEFQGSQGARALVLVTDGNAFEDDVEEEAALAYARQAGVKIYVLGLPFTEEIRTPVRVKGPDGTVVVSQRVERRSHPPNLPVLRRFTDATGGRAYAVKTEADLPRIFAAIERDLRTQYLVSYVSNAKKKGTFHPVEVRASRGIVSTAAGFFY
ncbi:MAG: VWA domain-containing protein, partial [Thermoanaerobaculia bacterium]